MIFNWLRERSRGLGVIWFGTRRGRFVAWTFVVGSLLVLGTGWALSDPWPALEIVTLDSDRSLDEKRADGPGVLAGSWDQEDFWGLPQEIPPQKLDDRSVPASQIRSSDQAFLIEARGSDLVRVDARSGAVLGQISIAPLTIVVFGFASVERSVRVVVQDQKWVDRVVTWDLDSGATREEPILASREFRPIGHSPDGRLGAFEGPLGSIHVWDLLGNRSLVGPLRASSVEPIGWGGAVFAPDGRTMIVGRGLSKVEVWDLPSGRLRRVLLNHPSGLSTARLVVAPDNRTIAWAALGPVPPTHFGAVWDTLARWFPRWRWFQNRAATLRSVALYDLRSGRLLGQIADADYPRFSPDGRFLATWRAGTKDFAIRAVPSASGSR